MRHTFPEAGSCCGPYEAAARVASSGLKKYAAEQAKGNGAGPSELCVKAPENEGAERMLDIAGEEDLDRLEVPLVRSLA